MYILNMVELLSGGFDKGMRNLIFVRSISDLSGIYVELSNPARLFWSGELTLTSLSKSIIFLMNVALNISYTTSSLSDPLKSLMITWWSMLLLNLPLVYSRRVNKNWNYSFANFSLAATKLSIVPISCFERYVNWIILITHP